MSSQFDIGHWTQSNIEKATLIFTIQTFLNVQYRIAKQTFAVQTYLNVQRPIIKATFIFAIQIYVNVQYPISNSKIDIRCTNLFEYSMSNIEKAKLVFAVQN